MSTKDQQNAKPGKTDSFEGRIKALPPELQLRIIPYIEMLSRADASSREYRAILRALEEETRWIRGLLEKLKQVDS